MIDSKHVILLLGYYVWIPDSSQNDKAFVYKNLNLNIMYVQIIIVEKVNVKEERVNNGNRQKLCFSLKHFFNCTYVNVIVL